MKFPSCLILAAMTGSIFVAAPAFAADPKKGKSVFASSCAACHGVDGAGGTGVDAPLLSGQDFLSTTSPAMLKAMIETGRPGRLMPGWKGALTPTQIDDVVAYVKSWQTVPSVSLAQGGIHGNVKKGKERFDNTCGTCHGVNGVGGAAPALNNAGFLKVATDGFIKKTLENGRSGTAMRTFAGAAGLANLDDQDLNDVVAYVRSWQKK